MCFGLASSARAEVVYGDNIWGLTLDAGDSITCVAYYVWGSVEFNDVPEQIDYTGYDNGGLWTDTGWQAELSPDNKIAYIYGPQATNDTGINNLGWFASVLSYQWDDAVEDSNYPVYMDTALYNGPLDSEPIYLWGHKGTPGIWDSWVYRDDPYAVDEPWYEEGFFSNPAPEPMTITLLALGAAALLRKRR